MIAIKPTEDQGIVILDASGQVIPELNAVNNELIDESADVVWLPGNALIFTFKNNILRTEPPYTAITAIKQIDYAEWGDIHPVPTAVKFQ